jgi:hypothetical protein
MDELAKEEDETSRLGLSIQSTDILAVDVFFWSFEFLKINP